MLENRNIPFLYIPLYTSRQTQDYQVCGQEAALRPVSEACDLSRFVVFGRDRLSSHDRRLRERLVHAAGSGFGSYFGVRLEGPLCDRFSAFVWRIILILFYYRPAEACSDEELPVCPVIVPAYNEGKQVLETVQSIASSDYPAEKLPIIAVDDGSTDDTWHWVQMAAREFPDRVLTRRQPVNSCVGSGLQLSLDIRSVLDRVLRYPHPAQHPVAHPWACQGTGDV